MKVVELTPRPKRISEETVKMLEDHLARARAGEIKSVAIVSLLQDGSSLTCSSESDNLHAMIGGLAILQHRMINDRQDFTDPDEPNPG